MYIIFSLAFHGGNVEVSWLALLEGEAAVFPEAGEMLRMPSAWVCVRANRGRPVSSTAICKHFI